MDTINREPKDKLTTPSKVSNYRPENVSYSLLPSANVVHKYGIPRSAAQYMQHNHWSIPDEYKSILSAYYLIYWSASYFQDKMVNGTVERDGVIYQVIYYRCNPAAIGSGSNQLALSFRSLVEEYKAQPVVLVTVL